MSTTLESDTSVKVKWPRPPHRRRANMRVGELARRTGASERSLRHYEKRGLLNPTRSSNGYRDYDQETVSRVTVIRTLLQAGLSTHTIAQLLPCVKLAGGQAVPCS